MCIIIRICMVIKAMIREGDENKMSPDEALEVKPLKDTEEQKAARVSW